MHAGHVGFPLVMAGNRYLKQSALVSWRSFGNFCSPLARKMYWFCFKIIAYFTLILEVTQFVSTVQTLRNSENVRWSVC